MNVYCDDNIAKMKSMETESVDLISTEPAYFTGSDFGEFDDRWKYGIEGHLNFMMPRSKEMRRIFKSTGSLFLQCDPAASSHLKTVMEKVFGQSNFRKEIV